MTRDEVLGALAQFYPALVPLIDKPGVFDVLDQALSDPLHPWTDAQIDYALKQTEYYRNTTLSQRRWDALQILDPATAREMGSEMTTNVLRVASQLGITLDANAQWITVTQGLMNGWDTNQITHWLVEGLQNGTFPAAGGKSSTGAGTVDAASQQIRQLARDYAVPLSPDAIQKWALQLLDGEVTQDGLAAYFIEQAKSLYPSLASALDSGISVRQYADPYAQIAQKELGINPNDFDLSDPKWGSALQQIDPKTGTRTAMTLSSWQSELRSNPIYGYDTTTNARDMASQFAQQLGQSLGAFG